MRGPCVGMHTANPPPPTADDETDGDNRGGRRSVEPEVPRSATGKQAGARVGTLARGQVLRRPMLWLLLLHVVVAASMPFAARRIGRAAFLLGAVAPAAALAWAVVHTPAVLAGDGLAAAMAWAPPLGLRLALRLDVLGWAMVTLVAGVGFAVLVYCPRYVERAEPRMGRLAGLLVAFAGAMLGLVLADNLLVLYVFWELTTVFSFLLIGHDSADEESRHAAFQALLVTTGLGLFMLVGFIVLGQAAGTYQVSALVADPPTGGLVTVALVLVILGAFAKSAQVPFHTWLPAAMVAPTPVSAYLHAAAMVKAGVYLVARLAPGFADAALWRPLIMSVGVASMLLGGWHALRQYDLKRLLAFGTVSQLGLLMVLFGAGTRIAAIAGIAMLLAHGAFKATLFLVAGVLARQTGTLDLRGLTGLWRRMPVLCAAALLAGASMAGIPPFLGYVGKEAAYQALEHAGLWAAALAGIVAGSVLTVAYTVRYLWGAFAGRAEAATPAPRPAAGFVAPAAVLAAAGLAFGLLPQQVDTLAAGYADVFGGDPAYHLALWHGLTPTLGLSALTLATGLGLHPARRWIERLRLPLPEIGDVYRAGLRGLDLAAVVLTRRTQVGSLPAYLTVLFVTLVAVPGTALATAAVAPEGLRLWDTPMQAVLGLLILAAAVGVAVARRRFTAVLMLSAAGYGVAGLFVAHGAPDVALVQFLVETMLLVFFVFVLRRLPPQFQEVSRRGRAPRAVALTVSGLVGTFVGAFFAVATSVPRPSGATGGYVARAGDAGGDNIVNLILVDFRALDTMGEISVLAVAAVGVASLVLVAWRGPASGRTDPVEGGDPAGAPGAPRGGPSAARVRRRRWLEAPFQPPLGPRSVLLEATTRALVPTALVVATYLLLAGHSRPGGGLAGGLVAGMALVLRYVAGGRYELSTAAPVPPPAIIGAGLLFSAGTGAAAWAAGEPVFTSTVLSATVPVFGHIELATSLVFDIGVFLVVLGLVAEILTALGAQVEEDERGAT